MTLKELTRKHGFKIPPRFPCSEECGLAVGEMVGHSNVKSAARMNGAVVIFVGSVEDADLVIENGVEVNDHIFPVLPLARSAVKITVSNVPPFVRDEVLTRELSRYGKVVSRVTKVSSGCKSPLLRHVVSHRRQLLMTLNNSSRELNVMFRIDVDGFDYVVYASIDDFRCFNCGKEGHQNKVCPERTGSCKDQNQLGTEKGRVDTEDRQEAQGGTGEVQKAREQVSGVEEAREEVREEASSVVPGVRVEEVREGVEEVGVVGTDAARVNAEGPVETDSGGDIEGCEEQLKDPQLKRKKGGKGGKLKAKKATTKGRDADVSDSSEEGDSRSCIEDDSPAESESCEDGGSRNSGVYSVEKIKCFRKTSKGIRGVRVEDYFSDKETFPESVRSHMSSAGRGGLTDWEVFRLRKLILKARGETHGPLGSAA